MTIPQFRYEPDEENPGWHIWVPADSTRFNGLMGKLIVRREDERNARVRMWPEHRHSNLVGNVHGGTLLSLVDIALFAAARVLGLEDAGRAVTLDVSAHFIGAGRTGEALDAEVELLRETGRLMFMRGLLVQSGDMVLSFSGTIRKASKRT